MYFSLRQQAGMAASSSSVFQAGNLLLLTHCTLLLCELRGKGQHLGAFPALCDHCHCCGASGRLVPCVGGQRLRSLPPQGRGRDFFALCYAWPWHCQLHLHGPKAANMSACCVLAISPHQAVWRVTLGLWMLQGAGCVPVLDWWCDPLPTPWRSCGFI